MPTYEQRSMSFHRNTTHILVGKLVSYLAMQALRIGALGKSQVYALPVSTPTEVPIHRDGRLFESGEVFQMSLNGKTVNIARTLSKETIVGSLGGYHRLKFEKQGHLPAVVLQVNLPSPAEFLQALIEERDFWLNDYQSDGVMIRRLMRQLNLPEFVNRDHYLAAYLIFINLYIVWVACKHQLPEAAIPGYIEGLKFEIDSLRGALPNEGVLPESLERWIREIRTKYHGAELGTIAEGRTGAGASRRAASSGADEGEAKKRIYDSRRMMFYVKLFGYRHPHVRRGVDYTDEAAKNEFVLFVFSLEATEHVLVAVDTLWTGRAANLMVGERDAIVEVCQRGMPAMRASGLMLDNRLIHYNVDVGGHDWWPHFREVIGTTRALFIGGRSTENLVVN